jgi:tetratricopeptide (TPR) repeat protein
MELGKWRRAASGGVAFAGLVLAANVAMAQFRELPAGGTDDTAVEIQLTPTREHFVAPRLQPVAKPQPNPQPQLQLQPQPEPTPAAEIITGTPTLAQPPLGVSPPAVQPTPAPAPAGQSASAEPAGEVRPPELFSAFRRASDASSAAPDLPSLEQQPTPLSFNQVTPGETMVADVTVRWGQPATTADDPAGKLMIYRAPGFQQVDLFTNRDGTQVKSIVVHLAEPLEVTQLETSLGLGQVRPAEISDDAGAVLGRGYPEHGVLLSYAPDSSGRQVTHIALEPVSGELYRLRAESDHERHYTQNVADLEAATRLNPDDARAHWLLAELLTWAGRANDAWQSVANATRVDATNPLYQLTRARLAAGNGDLTEATSFTKNVAQDQSAPPVVRARAEYQWGNLLVLGPEPAYQEALNHHLKAIDLAAPHARDKHTDVRRMARDLLVDAHLAIAQDIALGNFQRQREVVPKWLTRATELAEEYISDDQGDETIRMEIYRTTLAVYSVLQGNFDASIATDEAIKEGQRLVAASQDRLYQFRVERELSEVLYHAARVEHRCGRLDTAQKYVNNAVVLLEGDQQNWQPSLFDRVMTGQLYFLTGAIAALQDEDHAEAVKWFDKALPTFNDERLVHLVDSSAFGDLFVSMGVSYWETGERAKAIELTQAGAELMQDGVQAGSIEIAALSVPYGNLAAMHQEMGHGDRAKHFAELMAKVEKEANQPIRR